MIENSWQTLPQQNKHRLFLPLVSFSVCNNTQTDSRDQLRDFAFPFYTCEGPLFARKRAVQIYPPQPFSEYVFVPSYYFE